MKIADLPNCPQWLKDADTVDANVRWSPYGTIWWDGGAFLGGEFWGGAFLGGEFRGGEFWGGEFRGGEFRGGEFWRGAFLGGAFLGGAFWGVEFWGGEFRGGEFWGDKLTRNPLSVYGLRWPVVISETQMQIGCERHKIEKWVAFDNAQIVKMDRGALKFWREHKGTLLALCETMKASAEGAEGKEGG